MGSSDISRANPIVEAIGLCKVLGPKAALSHHCREMGNKYYREDFKSRRSDDVILAADNVTSVSVLQMNFSMELHRSEIVGIGGFSHCGMHELGKASEDIVGLFHAGVYVGICTESSGTFIMFIPMIIKELDGNSTQQRDADGTAHRVTVKNRVITNTEN